MALAIKYSTLRLATFNFPVLVVTLFIPTSFLWVPLLKHFWEMINPPEIIQNTSQIKQFFAALALWSIKLWNLLHTVRRDLTLTFTCFVTFHTLVNTEKSTPTIIKRIIINYITLLLHSKNTLLFSTALTSFFWFSEIVLAYEMYLSSSFPSSITFLSMIILVFKELSTVLISTSSTFPTTFSSLSVLFLKTSLVSVYILISSPLPTVALLYSLSLVSTIFVNSSIAKLNFLFL